MSNDRSGLPGMCTALKHLVWVVSGGVNVHGVAAMALVAASDAAPSRTGEIARDRCVSNFDSVDMCVASLSGPRSIVSRWSPAKSAYADAKLAQTCLYKFRIMSDAPNIEIENASQEIIY